jgi:hypothetical protein
MPPLGKPYSQFKKPILGRSYFRRKILCEDNYFHFHRQANHEVTDSSSPKKIDDLRILSSIPQEENNSKTRDIHPKEHSHGFA